MKFSDLRLTVNDTISSYDPECLISILVCRLTGTRDVQMHPRERNTCILKNVNVHNVNRRAVPGRDTFDFVGTPHPLLRYFVVKGEGFRLLCILYEVFYVLF